MGDLFCNLCKGISPRKLFAFFPNTLLPNSQWNKTLSLQFISKLFQLAVQSPHPLCVQQSLEAPPSHPVNNHINPGADFPSLCFARPGALPFPLAPGLASSDCCVWSLCAQPKAASLLSGEHSMSVGTVLFQSSSYGKEGSLLCCLGEGTSEPGVRFTGRMLSGVLSCPVPSLCFSKCFKEDEVLSSLSLSCSMRSATGRCKIASFYWGFGLVKCFFSMSSYMVFQKQRPLQHLMGP